MKTHINYRSLALTLLIMLSISAVSAKPVTEKIKVSGNCEMCETRIENAAKELKGVKSADWNAKTKILKVSFDNELTDLQKIQEAIAAAGHDTGSFKAKDEVYDKLPGCCKYEREVAKAACCGEAAVHDCGSSCE